MRPACFLTIPFNTHSPLVVRSQVWMLSVGPLSAHHEAGPSLPPPARSSTAAAPAQCMRFLKDLTHAKLMTETSALLGVQHLSDAPGPSQGPFHGFVDSPFSRPLVYLPVSMGQQPYKNIVFLIATGAAVTEISAQAFAALSGGGEGGAAAAAGTAVPTAAWVNLNGVRLQVRLCDTCGCHPDLPVLGADALAALGAKLHINYRAKGVTLDVA